MFIIQTNTYGPTLPCVWLLRVAPEQPQASRARCSVKLHSSRAARAPQQTRAGLALVTLLSGTTGARREANPYGKLKENLANQPRLIKFQL